MRPPARAALLARLHVQVEVGRKVIDVQQPCDGAVCFCFAGVVRLKKQLGDWPPEEVQVWWM